MEKRYVEMVIAAPFILTKGFLLGLMEGTGEKASYFFSKHTGIRVETLADGLKEWLGFENLVHLCLEKTFAEHFRKGIASTREKLGMEIKSEKEIESASFEFSAHLFDKADAESFHKRMDHQLPEGVYLDGFKSEIAEDPSPDVGVGAYAPAHKFDYRSTGRVVGEFGGVVKLYQELKDHRMIQVEDVQLNF